MSSGSKRAINRGRGSKSKRRIRGNKVEMVRKHIPTITTMNRKITTLKNRIELKYIDTLSNSTMNNAGTDIVLINALALGDNQQTRTGAEVYATSVQFRGLIQSNPNQIQAASVRIILFWDRQPNGIAPTVPGDPLAFQYALLNNNPITLLINSPFQYEAMKRFRVIYDKRFVINPNTILDFDIATGTTTALTANQRLVQAHIKLGRLVKYGDDVGTIQGVITNSLYAVFITDAGSNQMSKNFGFRFYFKDA